MKFYIGSSLKNSKIVDYFTKELEKGGWEHTYNWSKNIGKSETVQDLTKYAVLEKKAIMESDVVIIILPGGRGTNVELGMALALNKKIYLCSENEKEFSKENTVSFYELPSIKKICGSREDIIKEIIEEWI